MVMGFLVVVTSLTVFMFRAMGRASTVVPVALFVQVRREGSAAESWDSAKPTEAPNRNAPANRVRIEGEFKHMTLIYYILFSVSRS